MKKDVFGVKGDFITAPEVSQMFGEVKFKISSKLYFNFNCDKVLIDYRSLVFKRVVIFKKSLWSRFTKNCTNV